MSTDNIAHAHVNSESDQILALRQSLQSFILQVRMPAKSNTVTRILAGDSENASFWHAH